MEANGSEGDGRGDRMAVGAIALVATLFQVATSGLGGYFRDEPRTGPGGLATATAAQ